MVGEHGGVNPLREVTQLVDGGVQFGLGLVQQLRRQASVQRFLASQLQSQTDAEQALLRTVMPITFEPPPRFIFGPYQSGPGRPHFGRRASR